MPGHAGHALIAEGHGQLEGLLRHAVLADQHLGLLGCARGQSAKARVQPDGRQADGVRQGPHHLLQRTEESTPGLFEVKEPRVLHALHLGGVRRVLVVDGAGEEADHAAEVLEALAAQDATDHPEAVGAEPAQLRLCVRLPRHELAPALVRLLGAGSCRALGFRDRCGHRAAGCGPLGALWNLPGVDRQRGLPPGLQDRCPSPER
eukprot:3827999-Lingulodinium_polyedra.AAC.1